MAEQIIIGRLKDRSDFLKAKNGARSHERAFVLQMRKRDAQMGAKAGSKPDPKQSPTVAPHDDLVRFGFTVTKKVGNAVLRNRIKRRLREAVKLAQIPQEALGCDVVLIAREFAADQPFDALVNCISNALRSAKVRKTHPQHKASQTHVANRGKSGQKLPNES